MKTLISLLLFPLILNAQELLLVGEGNIIKMEINNDQTIVSNGEHKVASYDIAQATFIALDLLNAKTFYIDYNREVIVNCIYSPYTRSYHLSMKDYPDIGMRSLEGIKTLIANFMVNANNNQLWKNCKK